MFKGVVNAPFSFIITETGENVNNGGLSVTQKWECKKKAADNIANKLIKVGLIERGERMLNCSDTLVYKYCKNCGSYHVIRANLCRDRLCPICNWRLALQRYGDMKRMLFTLYNSYPEYKFSLVTLTVQNCKPEKLSETMSLMAKAWNLCLQNRSIKAQMQSDSGWARSTEITYNEKNNTLHPHYHILFAWADGNTEHGDFIIKQWIRACRKYGLTVTAKAQNNSSIKSHFSDENFTKNVLEVFKYAIKSKNLQEMPLSTFKQIAIQYSKKRLVAYGGKIKRLAHNLELSMDEIDREAIKICDDCGSMDLEEIILRWSLTEMQYRKFIEISDKIQAK